MLFSSTILYSSAKALGTDPNCRVSFSGKDLCGVSGQEFPHCAVGKRIDWLLPWNMLGKHWIFFRENTSSRTKDCQCGFSALTLPFHNASAGCVPEESMSALSNRTNCALQTRWHTWESFYCPYILLFYRQPLGTCMTCGAVQQMLVRSVPGDLIYNGRESHYTISSDCGTRMIWLFELVLSILSIFAF